MKPTVLMLKSAVLLAAFAGLTGIVYTQKPPRQERLLNGLKVVMWPDSRADKVWVSVRIHSGSAFDPQGKEGVMYLLGRNLFPNEASREFFTEDLGGSVEVVSNYDYIQVNAESNPASMVQMLDTLGQVVSNPTIDKETTNKIKAELLEDLELLEKDPGYLADMAAYKRLFGRFPYGRPEKGTKESLTKIDFAELVFAKNRFFGADNATMTISGKFDPDLAYRAVRRYFGAWLKSDKRVPSTFEQPSAAPAELEVISWPDPERSEIRFAARGYAKNDKDNLAASILANILDLRIARALPLSDRSKVSVQNEPHKLPGVFVFAIRDIKADSPAAAAAEFGAMIGKALSEPITAGEIVQIAYPAAPLAWLDADTYAFPPLKPNEPTPEASLSDVQRVADELRKKPMVSVILTKVNAN